MNDTNNPATHISTGIKVFVSLIVMGAIFFAGVYLGYRNQPAVQKITSLVHKEAPLTASTDFSPFWKAWSTVTEKLPGAEETPDTERMYGAIKGLMASFNDPYTTFFPPKENKIFETEIAGVFDGIGIELGQKDGILTVIAPLKNTPADRAGIESGDKIIKINDTITNDMSIDTAITLIRGKAGTPVALTIFRTGFTEPKVFTVTRENIALPTVDTETRPDKKVFVIHLYNFSAQSANLFRDAMNAYLASGYQNLLIDLRGNPGGYLDAAVQIGSWFVPEGKVIVKEIGKTESDVTVHASTGPVLFPTASRLIILADKGSASASEILAGALSEQGIGILVGEKTFGKGSVQEVIKLTPDTSLKITVAKWYTPKGISISDAGLTPSITIGSDKNTETHDEQLEQAIALFGKK